MGTGNYTPRAWPRTTWNADAAFGRPAPNPSPDVARKEKPTGDARDLKALDLRLHLFRHESDQPAGDALELAHQS
ncbi:hypothetical protein ThimaDRAFT_3679 [Thiocapsa marina 5811]|uniref:Uncharacterized protein n=1 Tax=Thiocapsa marina 5811 TaxID=768671 RepID=F9UFH6_9GAMM|nr:hypothetical protein ThimaDRAFT_3679 [Thiocapsa marina 5811]